MWQGCAIVKCKLKHTAKEKRRVAGVRECKVQTEAHSKGETSCGRGVRMQSAN